FSFSPQSNAVRKSRAARKEQHRDRHTHSHSQPLKAPCGYGWPNSPSAERKTRGDRPSEVVVKNVQRSLHPNLWAPCAPGERGLSPTPRGAEGWPPRAGSASRHASPAGGVWTEQHLQEGEGEESIASAPRLGPRRPQRSLRRRARLLGRAQWRRGRESASRWRALCRAARGERTDHKKKCAVAACNPPSRLVFSMRGPQKSRPTWDA
ncbi:unnamed protein product, partial [Prorocentrum cordatum]